MEIEIEDDNTEGAAGVPTVGRVVRVTDLGGKSDQLMVAEIQRSPSIQDGMETSPALPGNKCNESVCDEQGSSNQVIGRSFSRAAVIITPYRGQLHFVVI